MILKRKNQKISKKVGKDKKGDIVKLPETEETNPGSPQVPIELLRVKRRDFDVGGEKTPFATLASAPGLYKFKDIKDRLPVAEKDVRKWMTHGSLVGVFYYISPTGKADERVDYLDLQRFAKVLKVKNSGSSITPPSTDEDED